MKSWRLFLLASLLASAGSGAPVWRCLSSDHFDLYTDAPDKPAERILAKVEQFRSALLAANLPEMYADPGRVRIVLYRYPNDFAAVTPKEWDHVQVLGYATPSYVQPTLVLSLSQHVLDEMAPTDEHVMLHELVHALLMDSSLRGVHWFNEGMAEYLSNCRLRDGAALLGCFSPMDVEIIRAQLPMPLSELFAYSRNRSHEGFYPESWAFAHYCFHGGDPTWREKYFQFAAVGEKGHPTDEASFQKIFGCGTAEMDQRLTTYFKTGKFRTTMVQFAADATRGPAKWRTIGERERDAMLARVQLRARRPGDTFAKLQKLQNQNPGSIDLQLLKVDLTCDAGKFPEAREAMREAARLAPDNARVQAFAAWVTLAAAGERFSPGFASAVDEAREYAGQALRLDPHCVLATHVLKSLGESETSSATGPRI